MDAIDIKNVEGLKVWLESLPQKSVAEREQARQWAVTIAYRTAMRIMPFELQLFSKNRENLKDFLPIARSLLVSDMSARNRLYKIRFLAFKSSRHLPTARTFAAIARAASKTLVNILPDLNQTLNSASIVAEKIYDAAAFDCTQVCAGHNLEELPLWPFEHSHVNHWKTARKILLDYENGEFWVNWYENALHGRPQDYNLLNKIALIDHEDWGKGADHANALIQKIIAEHNMHPTTATAPLTKTMIERVQLSVQENGPLLAIQLGALLEIVDQEIERIRSTNNLEPDIRDGFLAALNKLKEAATEILALLPHAGAPSETEAEQIGSWGVILKEQAVHWNAEAKKFISGKPADDRVVLTGRIVLAAGVTGPLILMGLGPLATVAAGAILLKDKLDISKVVNAIKGGTPLP
jgi:hypothetical protein